MIEHFQAAAELVFTPQVLWVVALSALYGIFVGAIPGLTATMATALLVPLTMFLSPVEAIAAIVTTATCSIFAGDIPGALVRIPGTPASAAYTVDAYALAQRGLVDRVLGVCLVFSVIGGLFGVLVLFTCAPPLARIEFTSYEYFWMCVLGLSCAAVVSRESRLKGAFALLVGLLISTIGMGADFDQPRFAVHPELYEGVQFLPAMIGLFGISEILRGALRLSNARPPTSRSHALRGTSDGRSVSKSAALNVEYERSHAERGNEGANEHSHAERENKNGIPSGFWRRHVFSPLWTVCRDVPPFLWIRKLGVLRSSAIGSFIGMLPGAGADLAAWIAYAVSKRFSHRPQDYGRGSLEGVGDATAANNSAIAGAWVPTLLFGIPGDSVTAIAIGVLLMKNIKPRPEIFSDPAQATLVYSMFLVFVLANLLLIPFGLAAIRCGALLVKTPRRILLPLILAFCIVGAYSLQANPFDLWVMLAMGLLGFVLEGFGIPLGPVVLGIILGEQLELYLIQSWTKGEWSAFFLRPVSAVLVLAILALWFGPLLRKVVRRIAH